MTAVFTNMHSSLSQNVLLLCLVFDLRLNQFGFSLQPLILSEYVDFLWTHLPQGDRTGSGRNRSVDRSGKRGGHATSSNSDITTLELQPYEARVVRRVTPYCRNHTRPVLMSRLSSSDIKTETGEEAAVRSLFPERVISRFGNLARPPRLPDLSMCDFFLWTHLEVNVYSENSRNLEELKAALRNQTALFNEQLLCRVEEHFHEILECVFVESAVIWAM